MNNVNKTVTLPPLGTFFMRRYLYTLIANPNHEMYSGKVYEVGGKKQKVESLDTAIFIAFYLADNMAFFTNKSQTQLAEQLNKSQTPIKKALRSLRLLGLITTETTRYTVETEAGTHNRKGNNITHLVKPPVDWYCDNSYVVNEATAHNVVRAREYALQELMKKHPDLYFDNSFIATGKLKIYTADSIPPQRVDFVLSKGRKRTLLGSESYQHIRSNKELSKYLKEKEKANPEKQGSQVDAIQVEIITGNEKDPEPKEKETATTSKKQELTLNAKSDSIDPEDNHAQNETEDMKISKPKLAGNSKAPEEKVSTSQLQEKLQKQGRVKPSYKQKRADNAGGVLTPTNKNNKVLYAACAVLRAKAKPGDKTAVHHSHPAAVEALAKTISELNNERNANYTEAIKVIGYVMQNYSRYCSIFHADEKNKTIPSDWIIFNKVYHNCFLEFVSREKQRFESFDVVTWALGSSQSQKAQATEPSYGREPSNPVGAPPKPPKRKSAAKPDSKTAKNTGLESGMVTLESGERMSKDMADMLGLAYES